MFNLNGKIALVTGAGSGIGEAISRLFHSAGARVLLVDQDVSAGQRVADEIGGEFHAVDISDPDGVEALSLKISRLDVLVNNAGIGHVGNLLATTASDLDSLHAVNVRGAFNFCHAFVPAMLKRGAGSVINMASVAGIVAVRERLAYTTTKFAIVGLTKALALDHSHSGVRFNAICPGRVETPFVQARIAEYPDPEQAYRDMASTQLAGRMVLPAEVAAAALYLAADASAMVTGTTFMIDSGWSAGK